ncbi:MAG: hypothetical protein MJ201_02985 [Mycoplasmoidaceae bacterium]|nr:hypothetical protein [Mycoplasmoidaceae bacterium]
MKLLKKLLPVAAIASTAAIVAPIVTSCGAGVSFSSDFENGVIKEEYKAKVAPHAGDETGMKNAEAKKAYFDDVAKNKTILADD